VVQEYCWAITQAAGRLYCGRSDSAMLEFGFLLGCLVHKYTYTVDHRCIQYLLAQNSVCAGFSGT
jgi:hypothetical protein